MSLIWKNWRKSCQLEEREGEKNSVCTREGNFEANDTVHFLDSISLFTNKNLSKMQ